MALVTYRLGAVYRSRAKPLVSTHIDQISPRIGILLYADALTNTQRFDHIGVDVASMMTAEINKELGQGPKQSIGEDIQFLLNKARPIDRRTLADNFVAKFKYEKDLETKSRVSRVKNYRDSIKTMRRN